jgi:hypothetical protein
MPDTSTESAAITDAVVSKVRHEIAAANEQLLARLDGIERTLGTLYKQLSQVIESLDQPQD